MFVEGSLRMGGKAQKFLIIANLFWDSGSHDPAICLLLTLKCISQFHFLSTFYFLPVYLPVPVSLFLMKKSSTSYLHIDIFNESSITPFDKYSNTLMRVLTVTIDREMEALG